VGAGGAGEWFVEAAEEDDQQDGYDEAGDDFVKVEESAGERFQMISLISG